jgi:Tfp pilus assembly protein PilN
MSHMHALSVNFVQQRSSASWLGVMLFVAGVMAAGTVAIDLYDAQTELARIVSRQAALTRALPAKTPRTKVLPAAAEDAKLIGRVDAQLRQPWNDVFQEIDKLAGPAVALISIEAQGQTRSIRLSGEVKTMSDLVKYVASIRESSSIQTASLSHHEERQTGAVTVIRFVVDATWKAPL